MKAKRIAPCLLLSLLLMLALAPLAQAASEWKRPYLNALKQNSGKRLTALCDLTGDGEPELVVLCIEPSSAASLKVYTMGGGQAEPLGFAGEQLSLTGVRSASMALRVGKGKQTCLSIGLTAVEKKRTTTVKLGLVAAETGGLRAVFDARIEKQNGKTSRFLGGEAVTSAVYAQRNRAYEAGYKKIGSLPSKAILKADKGAAIDAKFDRLVKSYQSYSTVRSMKLSKSKAELRAGNTLKLSVSIAPGTAVSDVIAWQSSDTALATVDENGKVKALKAGEVVITAKTRSGKKKTCALTLKGPLPASVELEDNVLALVLDQTVTLKGSVLPEEANQAIRWSSSNSKVASVDKSGTITGVKRGRATITAKSANGKTASCKVVVNDGPAVIIDISQHNYSANIDWKKVSENVHLIIIRCGVTRTETEPIGVGKDDRFAYFAQKCKEYDIPFGVYFYGKCSDEEMAKAEARMTWEVASPYKPLFYVYDVEESRLNKKLIETYMKTLQGLGAKRTGYYIAHHLYSKFKLDTSLVDFIWIPHYGKNSGQIESTPSYACDIHQYTSMGKIPGFPGNMDVNRLMGRKTLTWFLGGK